MQSSQGSQPPSLGPGGDSKAGRGVRMLYYGKREGVRCPAWRLSVWGRREQAN